MLTPDDLLAFENDIADCFARGEIKAPVHLGGGNEAQLIDIFRTIQPHDWVLCGWRSHYHCLLKGVPAAELKAEIRCGHSVSLCFPRHKILCSGIVGGIAPIAVGLAWAIKKAGVKTGVHCFLGDMSAQAGVVHEAMKYAGGHELPVHWIVEDNGLSVCTNTRDSWGHGPASPVQRYSYKLTRPHVGINSWVRF